MFVTNEPEFFVRKIKCPFPPQGRGRESQYIRGSYPQRLGSWELRVAVKAASPLGSPSKYLCRWELSGWATEVNRARYFITKATPMATSLSVTRWFEAELR